MLSSLFGRGFVVFSRFMGRFPATSATYYKPPHHTSKDTIAIAIATDDDGDDLHHDDLFHPLPTTLLLTHALASTLVFWSYGSTLLHLPIVCCCFHHASASLFLTPYHHLSLALSRSTQLSVRLLPFHSIDSDLHSNLMILEFPFILFDPILNSNPLGFEIIHLHFLCLLNLNPVASLNPGIHIHPVMKCNFIYIHILIVTNTVTFSFWSAIILNSNQTQSPLDLFLCVCVCVGGCVSLQIPFNGIILIFMYHHFRV